MCKALKTKKLCFKLGCVHSTLEGAITFKHSDATLNCRDLTIRQCGKNIIEYKVYITKEDPQNDPMCWDLF